MSRKTDLVTRVGRIRRPGAADWACVGRAGTLRHRSGAPRMTVMSSAERPRAQESYRFVLRWRY